VSLLYLDMPSGVAGDMLLAALLQAAGPGSEAVIRDQLAGLGVGPIGLSCATVQVGGLSAWRVTVDAPQEPLWGRSAVLNPQAAAHEHRPYRRIRELLDRTQLAPRVKARAQAVFRLLAEAEAEVHGVDPESVEFHEVGSLDAIADVVGCCLALELLGVERIIAGSLTPGHGTVRCAHGLMPVPVPAVTRMLDRVLPRSGVRAPWRSLDRETGELTTPTGAALVCALTDEFLGANASIHRALTVTATGTGAGTKVIPGLVNVVRVLVASEGAPSSTASSDTVVEFRCQVDDMTGEHLALAMERILAVGALDVLAAPVLMKKGRPGHALTVLATPSTAAIVEATILSCTTTIGVRRQLCERTVLPREQTVLTVRGETVSAKQTIAPDGSIRIKPEAEDIRARFWTWSAP
jgi:uncharacterized protein (TIGR00299 family) protein